MEPVFKFYFNNKFRPLASLSLHEVAAFECPPGYTLPLKRPDAFALYFTPEGRGLYTLAGREFPVEQGDCFALYPDTDIEIRSGKQTPWTLVSVSFDGADARLLLNAAGFEPKHPVRPFEGRNGEQIVDVMTAIYSYRGQEIFSLAQSTALIYALMSLLVKTNTWDQSAMPPGWTGTVHFQKALDFIAHNYAQPITVMDIAEAVNLSRSRLYRVFMQQIFISPQQYLTEYRIREAQRLLERRSGSVKEIALAVGFEDPLYFSTLFKQVTGKSPTNFMKGLISGES